MSTRQQLTLDLEHRPSVSGHDFLVAPANAVAIEWIDLWPDWPEAAVSISGPSGSGKSHLAHVFQARSSAPLITRKLLSDASLRDLVDSNTALVVDDADKIVAAGHEEAFFHLLNILREQNKKMFVLSESAPARWNIALPDLRSRLNALPHASIGMPDEMLLGAVVVKLFSDRQVRVDHGVIEYLVARMERSFSGARTLVQTIDKAAMTEQRTITVPFVREILQRVPTNGQDSPNRL